MFSEALKEIKVSYVSNTGCSIGIQENFLKYITPDKICAANLDSG